MSREAAAGALHMTVAGCASLCPAAVLQIEFMHWDHYIYKPLLAPAVHELQSCLCCILTLMCSAAALEVAAQAADSEKLLDGIASSLVSRKRIGLRTCLLGFLFRSSACCKST